MQYIPNTYPKNIEMDEEKFLNLQLKYREGISMFLSQFIDYKSIDKKICDFVNIPVVDDSEYNFYHMKSSLNSKYLYLRNNIHIERLSDEELEELINNDFSDLTFYKDKLEKVLYEDGDMVSYGIYPNNSNTKKSKALIFEFAYDQRKCESIEQLKKIEIVKDEIFSYIKSSLENSGINCDFLVYQCLPVIFTDNKANTK